MRNALVSTIMVLLAAQGAHAQTPTATVLLKEYGVGDLKPALFKATADDSDVVSSIDGNEIRLSIPDGTRRLRLTLGGGQEFRERQVALYAAALPTTRTTSFVVERKRASFTREYLSQGLARLDRERDPDAALALFDYAYRDSAGTDTELDAYQATLRYNYARALQQTCLRLEFDTCDEAKQTLDGILESMVASSGDRRIYESVRVTAVLVRKALDDLASRAAKLQYDTFTAAIAAGNYEQAQVAIDAIEKSLTTDPMALKSQRLTPSRIAKDRAFVNSRSTGL
jgi:hypothetical protein